MKMLLPAQVIMDKAPYLQVFEVSSVPQTHQSSCDPEEKGDRLLAA